METADFTRLPGAQGRPGGRLPGTAKDWYGTCAARLANLGNGPDSGIFRVFLMTEDRLTAYELALQSPT
jgi:hypothetical protein